MLYAGKEGFFGRHMLKMYGFLINAFHTGLRGQTVGGQVSSKMWSHAMGECLHANCKSRTPENVGTSEPCVLVETWPHAAAQALFLSSTPGCMSQENQTTS